TTMGKDRRSQRSCGRVKYCMTTLMFVPDQSSELLVQTGRHSGKAPEPPRREHAVENQENERQCGPGCIFLTIAGPHLALNGAFLELVDGLEDTCKLVGVGGDERAAAADPRETLEQHEIGRVGLCDQVELGDRFLLPDDSSLLPDGDRVQRDAQVARQ